MSVARAVPGIIGQSPGRRELRGLITRQYLSGANHGVPRPH